MIINDHILTEFICNLRCTYCSSKVNLMRRERNFLKVSSHGDTPIYKEPVSNFLDRNQKVIKQSKHQKGTPILKLSGGEIFLIPEFMDILPSLSNEYAVVQILTNGTLLTPQIIKKLQKFSNIHLQISLDGHTTKMNSCRFQNPKTLTTILNNLTLISHSDIPLEINCVLTKVNIDGFFEFVEVINNLIQRCIIYPFPVRSHLELFPQPTQINLFIQNLEKKFSSLKHLLPPIQYLNALIEFMKNKKRIRGCYIPYIVLATYGDGQLDVCTCGSVKNLGNVLLSTAPYSRIRSDSCYNNIINPNTSPSCCKNCFTHYDIINLFLEGDISITKLKTIPFFAAQEIIKKLIATKKEMKVYLSKRRNKKAQYKNNYAIYTKRAKS